MLLLTISIDGCTQADLVAELREALRRVEAGETRGETHSAASSLDFRLHSYSFPNDTLNTATVATQADNHAVQGEGR